MKLKNSTIITLCNAGILNTTEHDVPVKDAYKAFAFRKSLQKSLGVIIEKEKDLRVAAGIDPKNPDAATEEQRKRFEELYGEFLNDETEVKASVMSYESYHALANENKQVKIQIPVQTKEGKPVTKTIFADPFRDCEDLLEGVLWVAPEEED